MAQRSEGRRLAFLAFYDAHKDALYRFLLSQCGGGHEAADLLQDVFLRMWQRAGDTGDEILTKPYAYAAAYHAVLAHRTRRRRDRALAESALQFRETRGEDEGWGEAVTRALAALDGDCRLIVLMHVFDGFQLKDIAGILDMPYDNVTYRWQQSLDRMRPILRKEIE